ncbi:hypothetical protein AQ916_23025 [Burkholderia pseudomallei]|nr:hypothetical protein AQ916_23025 [Burkholderia pseudomallei]
MRFVILKYLKQHSATATVFVFFYLIAVEVAHIEKVPQLKIDGLCEVHSRLRDKHEQLSLHSQIGERVSLPEFRVFLGARLPTSVTIAD